jgi:hypothetical protein
MASKSLRYHYRCQFNHETIGISIPHSNLSYILGTTVRGAPKNALQWVNCRDWNRFPDPLWRHPSYGQVQPGSRRLAPAHLIDGISSVCREIKTERQRVSRDLAVRRVVLPGWVKSVVRAIPSSTETPEHLPDIHEGPPNLAESNGMILKYTSRG